jgi:arginase family enzyme
LLDDGVRIGPDFDGLEAQRMLVHVDLDVIDSRHGRANQYACEGGPSPDEVLRVIETARERFPVAGLVIASYDPSCDGDGRIAEAAVKFVRAFC